MLMAGGYIAIVAAMLAFGRGRLRGAIGVAIGVVIWTNIDTSVTQQSLGALPARIATLFVNASTMLVTRITAPSRLHRLYADAVKRIALESPLPPLAGGTDVYSYGQSMLLANGLDWAPRPVLQSYLAYTPALAAADAAYLSRPQAARNILFSVQPIDGRLGALEDGPSWPELLRRYEFTDLRGDTAIMRRREVGVAQPAADEPIADQPVSEGSFRMGDNIALPAGTQPVWAKVDVAPTLFGKLASIVFRPAPLWITYRFQDGHQQAFRYISGMGRAGFLASPVVTSTGDFVSLALPGASEYLAAKRPQSFTILGHAGRRPVVEAVGVGQFFPVSFPAQPDVGRFCSTGSRPRRRVRRGSPRRRIVRWI